MSASSSAARTAGSVVWAVALHQQLEMLDRAGHRPDRLGRHPGIERRCVQFRMSKQHLDDANVDILLQEVGGKAVAQRVWSDARLDAGGLGGFLDETSVKTNMARTH